MWDQKRPIYIDFEVESLDAVVAMVDDFRQGDPRLHTYFTLQATLGRAFWPIEGAWSELKAQKRNNHHPIDFQL